MTINHLMIISFGKHCYEDNGKHKTEKLTRNFQKQLKPSYPLPFQYKLLAINLKNSFKNRFLVYQQIW